MITEPVAHAFRYRSLISTERMDDAASKDAERDITLSPKAQKLMTRCYANYSEAYDHSSRRQRCLCLFSILSPASSS